MRLLPRDERFFDLFTKVATLNVEAAKQLQVLLATDMDRRLPIVESIKRLEHEADIITHEVVTRLDRSFITPLDREDIHTLASRLDDVMDLMDGCSRKVQVFHAGDAPKGAILLAETIVGATEQLLVGVKHLDKSRDGEVLQACIKVKRPRRGRGRDLSRVAGRPLQGRPRTRSWSSAGRRSTTRWRRPSTTPRTSPTCWSPSSSSTPDRDDVRRVRARHHRGRAGLRLHQRLSRQRQFDRDRGVHPGAFARRRGGLGGVRSTSSRAFVVGTAVAKTIGKGLIQPSVVDPNVVLAALIGAIIWNLVTWYLGLPSSSSHALIGGLRRGGGRQGRRRRAHRRRLGQADPLHLHLAADRHAAGARPHGGALLGAPEPEPRPDGQALPEAAARVGGALLPGPRRQRRPEDHGHRRGPAGRHRRRCSSSQPGCCATSTCPTPTTIPLWVELAAYSAIALGTALGGWRIVKTMGTRITKLRPVRRLLRRDRRRHLARRSPPASASP